MRQKMHILQVKLFFLFTALKHLMINVVPGRMLIVVLVLMQARLRPTWGQIYIRTRLSVPCITFDTRGRVSKVTFAGCVSTLRI
jgi:hypothetical protein